MPRAERHLGVSRSEHGRSGPNVRLGSADLLMNRKQLQKLGVPPDCTKAAIQALVEGGGAGHWAWGSRASGRGNSWPPLWRIRGS